MSVPVPLRHLLLAVLGAFGVLLVAGQFTFILHTYSQDAMDGLAAIARHAGGTLAAGVNAELAAGGEPHLQPLILQTASLPDLAFAAYVASDDRVRDASVPDLIGTALSDRAAHLAPPAGIVDEVRRAQRGVVRRDAAGGRLWAVFPVPAVADGERAPPGYVVLGFGTAALERAALHRAFGQSMIMVAPLLLLLAGVAMLVRSLLTDRVEQLLAYTRSQAEGGRLPPPVTGGDELGQLGARLAVLMQSVIESRDYHVRLLDRMPNPIWRAGSERRCDYVNQAWLAFTGTRVERALGAGWLDVVHADDRERCLAVYQGAFDAREPFTLEYRLRFRDGGYHWVHDHGEPLYGGDGSFLGYIGSAFDVQGDKEAEEEIRRLNTELEERVERRTVQLAALNRELETFTYSVSHDLKAPLRGIDGYSHLLLEDHARALDDEGKLFVRNIRAGVAQMARLIDDLLAYSRLERRALQRSVVNLADMVRAVLAERASELGAENAEVDVAVGGITVNADREGLAQALRNLIDNAFKYSRHAAQPTIRIDAHHEAAVTRIRVQDNGIGFDMKFHDRIFDIFQRLQRAEDYAGTGVGLAIVRKAMQRMDGRAWAESAPGEGATFFLELPR